MTRKIWVGPNDRAKRERTANADWQLPVGTPARILRAERKGRQLARELAAQSAAQRIAQRQAEKVRQAFRGYPQ